MTVFLVVKFCSRGFTACLLGISSDPLPSGIETCPLLTSTLEENEANWPDEWLLFKKLPDYAPRMRRKRVNVIQLPLVEEENNDQAL